MDKTEFLALVDDKAKQDSVLPRFVVDALTIHPYLWVDNQTRKAHAAAAIHAQVGSADKPHCVVLSCYVPPGQAPEFFLHCGDAFLEGTKDTSAVRTQMAAVSPSFAATAAASLMREHGSMPRSTGCNFWRNWNSPEKKLCKHTAHFLTQARDMPAVLTSLEEAACLFTDQTIDPATVVTHGELTFEDLAFKAFPLLEGERGVGKTTEAMNYVAEHDCAFFELQGHAGIETLDMLGHTTFMPGAEKQAVWVDGPLSAAFRAASRGKKTILVIDEILRIPESQQTALLGPFAPFKGEYRLNTGRILNVEDGVGVTETLRVKCENLWVVATTNVGIEYAVSKMDPALRERFVPMRRGMSDALLEDHLRVACAKFGADCPATVAKLKAFYTALALAKKGGMLHDVPTSRTLCRAVNLVNDVASVPAGLRAQIGLWVGRDPHGNYIPEQEQRVKKAIDKIFV